MIRTAVTAVAFVVLLTAGGCASSDQTRTDQSATAHAGKPADPADPLPEIMYAKLNLANRVVAGLVTEDFAEIELSAVALRRLSESSAWMVTDSVTYVVMSDEFRSVVDDMGANARSRDLVGTTAEFTRLIESCVRCHRYLRKELFENDLPDRVSDSGRRLDVLDALVEAVSPQRRRSSGPR